MSETAVERFHFIGVGGRAMGAIALALARAGHRVTGSDEGIYEPMSGYLRRGGIHVAAGYAEGNVGVDAPLVVVGKRVTSDNPELLAVIRRGLRFVSFPQLLRDRFLTRSRNAVVAGGVGKTTTTAMLAWILEHAGVRPDYLVGGVARNFPHAVRFDGRGIAVLEGDEYASCFDDQTPKFLHYAPEVVVVTNILEDHPDLYPDVGRLREAFGALVRLLPADGRLVLSSDDEAVASLSREAACSVVTTGFRDGADHPIVDVHFTPQGSGFRLGDARFELPVFGRMNVQNGAMAAVAAAHFGVSWSQSARALAEFAGVDDRQDGREAGGCTIVTDMASHPHSLGELSHALRQRYPGRRLISVIQPRATGGRRWIYQRDLPAALARFDQVILTSAYEHKPPHRTGWQSNPFSVEALAQELQALAVDVTTVPSLPDVPGAVREAVQDGDVVLLSLREQFVDYRAAVHRALVDRQRAAVLGRTDRSGLLPGVTVA